MPGKERKGPEAMESHRTRVWERIRMGEALRTRIASLQYDLDKHCVWHYLQTDGGLVMRKFWNPTISTFFTKMLINTSIYMNYSIDL